jgi:RNA polymerase sigma factor (sigma-70 family)
MEPNPSVSEWIASLKAGDADAAQHIWHRFAQRLTELARRKLGRRYGGLADEEDIAQSVFSSVCRGAAAGRFADINNRDELWWILLAITKQKIVDHVRRESAKKRGGELKQALPPPSGQFPAFSLDELVGNTPTPDFLVMLEEQNNRLMNLLRDERMRHIATSRIEGYTIPEIAADLSVSERTVERKLNLIRKAWADELSRAV